MQKTQVENKKVKRLGLQQLAPGILGPLRILLQVPQCTTTSWTDGYSFILYNKSIFGFDKMTTPIYTLSSCLLLGDPN